MCYTGGSKQNLLKTPTAAGRRYLAAHTAHHPDHLAGQADVAPLPNNALLEAKPMKEQAGRLGCRMSVGSSPAA